MESSTGIISLVQEDRFQLSAEDGGHALFILTHRARIDGDDLHRLARESRRVRVRHEAAPGCIARIAFDVTPLGEES